MRSKSPIPGDKPRKAKKVGTEQVPHLKNVLLEKALMIWVTQPYPEGLEHWKLLAGTPVLRSDTTGWLVVNFIHYFIL